jgi:hypothetical protein
MLSANVADAALARALGVGAAVGTARVLAGGACASATSTTGAGGRRPQPLTKSSIKNDWRGSTTQKC